MRDPDFLIYGLIDPRSRFIRYVGLSATGMARPRRHRYPSRQVGYSHRECWLRELVSAGLDFQIAILEVTSSRDNLPELERWWIAFGRACGWPLTNLTDGGEGAAGHRMPETTRKAIRAANLGSKRTLEQKARMSAARFELFNRRPDLRARLGTWSRGRKPSPEALAKMSANSASRRPEVWQKIAAKTRERVVSAETRAKMGAAQRIAWAKRKAARHGSKG